MLALCTVDFPQDHFLRKMVSRHPRSPACEGSLLSTTGPDGSCSISVLNFRTLNLLAWPSFCVKTDPELS